MFPDMKGLGELIALGIGALIVLVAAIPIATAYGLSWLLEPRLGVIVWTVHLWASIGWALVVAAFFGTALFGHHFRRR